jgi:hypothetical protein
MNINKLYLLDFIFTKINEKSSINELSLMVRRTWSLSLLPTVHLLELISNAKFFQIAIWIEKKYLNVEILH